jgi:hypothetical protein
VGLYYISFITQGYYVSSAVLYAFCIGRGEGTLKNRKKEEKAQNPEKKT